MCTGIAITEGKDMAIVCHVMLGAEYTKIRTAK